MTVKRLAIDVDIASWKLREQMDYREKIGVNPQYAFVQIAKAFEGYSGDTVPDAALNIPAEYLLGMAWVTMRRKDPALSLDDVTDIAGTSEALFTAFAESMGAAEEPEPERPTRAGKAQAPARTSD